MQLCRFQFWERPGTGYFRHLVDLAEGTSTVADRTLDSLARRCLDVEATEILNEFALGNAVTKPYQIAAKADGDLLRIEAGLGEQVVAVKNLALPIL